LARLEDLAVSHRVAVLKRSFEDVRDNLHVLMAMRAKPVSGRNPVFIHHPQRTKPHMISIEVICERERVICVEPAMIKMAALAGFPYLQHFRPLIKRLHSRPSESYGSAALKSNRRYWGDRTDWKRRRAVRANRDRSFVGQHDGITAPRAADRIQ